MLNDTSTPQARPAPPRLLDFVSRERSLVTRFLAMRAEAKALKEEFNELGLATQFDAAIWDGDNAELGAHKNIAAMEILLALNALDVGENSLNQDGHIAALLRIKE